MKGHIKGSILDQQRLGIFTKIQNGAILFQLTHNYWMLYKNCPSCLKAECTVQPFCDFVS